MVKYGREWIVQIQDITDFVHEQYKQHVVNKEWDKLVVAEERVYRISDVNVATQIKLTQNV